MQTVPMLMNVTQCGRKIRSITELYVIREKSVLIPGNHAQHTSFRLSSSKHNKLLSWQENVLLMDEWTDFFLVLTYSIVCFWPGYIKL